jgi:Fur family ferric uptake transcriptional regulator
MDGTGRKTKSSKKRNIILDVIKENPSKHMTVEEIYKSACEKDNGIGVATVYRNLKFLEDKSIIKKASISESMISCYELQKDTDIHSHHHLTCRECGAVSDFEEDLLDAIEKIINVTTGFEIQDHNLVFYGKCKKCKEVQKNG